MQQVIMAIHLMTVVALVILVLYQKSEGGALGLGQSGFFSGRGQANALTRATGILGTIFFLTSILLTVIPAWERRSIGGEDWTKAVEQEKVQIKEVKPEAAPQAKETQIPKDKDSIFEQLKRAQEQRQQGAGAPAMRKAPEAEAPAQPAQKVEAPKAEEPKPAEAKPEAPNAAAPPAASPPAAATKPETEPRAGPAKTDTPNAAAPPAVAPPASEAEKPASAPKSEAKPEDSKPAPEAAPAPAAPPPPVQWKSPTH
jgi:protein translocase SecG subunit